MKVRLLKTDGLGEFSEIEWDKPDITTDEIEVKSVMTGVCRSDIEMMIGKFGPLPLNMQGHEGLGIVTKVGKNILDVKEGDFVATRGEPAYADLYSCRKFEYAKVPELSPKYILEPVACGINVVEQCLPEIIKKQGKGKRLLLLGSGFLSWVAFSTIQIYHLDFEITVVGHNNKEIWGDILKDQYDGTFDVIIDLSSDHKIFDRDIFNIEALVIFGSQKEITTNFGNILWKSCTLKFPSPRTKNFYKSLKDAAYFVETKKLEVDKFWTQCYNRETNWRNAFLDGLNRPKNYSRGYICWIQSNEK